LVLLRNPQDEMVKLVSLLTQLDDWPPDTMVGLSVCVLVSRAGHFAGREDIVDTEAVLLQPRTGDSTSLNMPLGFLFSAILMASLHMRRNSSKSDHSSSEATYEKRRALTGFIA
jgi:hypothetical protein